MLISCIHFQLERHLDRAFSRERRHVHLDGLGRVRSPQQVLSSLERGNVHNARTIRGPFVRPECLGQRTCRAIDGHGLADERFALTVKELDDDRCSRRLDIQLDWLLDRGR